MAAEQQYRPWNVVPVATTFTRATTFDNPPLLDLSCVTTVEPVSVTSLAVNVPTMAGPKYSPAPVNVACCSVDKLRMPLNSSEPAPVKATPLALRVPMIASWALGLMKCTSTPGSRVRE